jgi:hypothetical protein
MGHTTARAALALSLIATLAHSRQAGAELEARADAEDASPIPLDQHTAFTVPRHALKVGVLSLEYGLTDGLSVGIDPALYIARAFSDYIVPNAHLKAELLRHERVTISGKVAGYYAVLDSDTGPNGHVLIVPVSVFASMPIVPRLWVHLEGNYNHARGVGDNVSGRAQVEGTVASRNFQAGAMVEYRLSPLIGLLARGRVQMFTSPLVINAEGPLDPYTTAQLAANYRPTIENPWVALGAVAFTWRHVGAIAGVGYGQYFIPGGNLPVPYQGITPEASLWVVF